MNDEITIQNDSKLKESSDHEEELLMKLWMNLSQPVMRPRGQRDTTNQYARQFNQTISKFAL